MSEKIAYQQAMVLVSRAYKHQMNGRFGHAIELYEQSIDLHPTAEAHTYLGWTYSMMRRYEEATEQCHLAIETDPSFGNPYNDIGAYLLERGKWEEAMPWFEQALEAERYDNPHFALMNIGRVHERLGRARSAIQFYDKALAMEPLFRPALIAKQVLLARLN